MQWASGPRVQKRQHGTSAGVGQWSGHTRLRYLRKVSASCPREQPPVPRQANRRIVRQSTCPDRHESTMQARQRHFPAKRWVVPTPPTRPGLSPPGWAFNKQESASKSKVGHRPKGAGGSPVRVAWTPPGRLSRSTSPRRRAGTLHPKLGHHIFADLGLEPPQDR
jgi:hypothetical protein